MTSVFTPSFNLTQAQDVTITGTPPSGDTVNGSSASGNTTSSTSASKKSNTPIIVGVVVGVVGLLALVALALFLIRRRQKKSRVPPSAEFMKYAQHDRMGSVNLPTSSHPLMGNMGTADDEEDGRRSRTNLRGSVIRLDGTDNSHDGTGGGGGTSGAGHTSAGMSGSTERDGAPPAFTPGLFKDPIFEKGVALNLAGMSGGGPASGSPVTYSPATPSSAAQNHQNNTEKQRLIQSRHGTA
ncbi:hypothetical protein CPB86DRAFT_782067 [Serendipita vermifera]|nr:hypothetical protein CPB86DRAFT_782067 [Serendipita vermifera]